MKKKIFSMLLAVLLLSAAAAGCGSSDNGESAGTEGESKDTIVIGGTSISQVFYDAIKDKYEAMGYKTEFKSFDSNQVVLEACASDEVDIAIGQHKKFVQSFDDNNGADLDMVKPYGMYTADEVIGKLTECFEGKRKFNVIVSSGVIEDITIDSAGGFDTGVTVIRSDSGEVYRVTFQNENLFVEDEKGKTLVTVPNIISILDLDLEGEVRSLSNCETKVGQRVALTATQADKRWYDVPGFRHGYVYSFYMCIHIFFHFLFAAIYRTSIYKLYRTAI